MKNDIVVTSLDKRFRGLERSIEEAAIFFLGSLEKSGVDVEIYLVNNARMRSLNRGHCGKDVATNVLAFNTPEGFPSAGSKFLPIGEIYLSPPYIRNRNEDINCLLLHGLLHLIGFNHENKSDRMKMEKLEEEVITLLREKNGR